MLTLEPETILRIQPTPIESPYTIVPLKEEVIPESARIYHHFKARGPAGWCQNLMYDRKGAHCLIGAIIYCYRDSHLSQNDVMKQVVNRITGPIVEWNDAPYRKFEDVLELCKEERI